MGYNKCENEWALESGAEILTKDISAAAVRNVPVVDRPQRKVCKTADAGQIN
jgi:hypothetical protein